MTASWNSELSWTDCKIALSWQISYLAVGILLIDAIMVEIQAVNFAEVLEWRT